MKNDELQALLGDLGKPHAGSFRMAGLSAAAAATAAVCLLGLSGWFITGAALAGVAGVLAVQGFNYMLPSAGIRLLAIVRTIARYGERYHGHRGALLTLADVRGRLFTRLLRAHDLRAVSAGAAVSGLVQDIGALEDRLVRKPSAIAAIAGALTGACLAALAGVTALLALLFILGALVVGSHMAAPRLLAAPARQMGDALAALKSAMLDHASAAPDIVAYRMEQAVQAELEAKAAVLDAARLRFARGEAMIGAGLTLGGGVASAAMLALSAGPTALTILAALAAAGAVECLAGYVRGIAREAAVTVGLSRLEQLTRSVGATAQRQGAPVIQGARISIGSGAETIQLAAGERLAITGRSGSGKTRLMETLAGIRPSLNDGALAVDGMALQGLSPDAVRNIFALSPQDAQLIAGTIRDNLRIARTGLTDDQLWSALEIACLGTELRAMADGLDHWVGDGGVRLSGGQRKRLSIARALLAERPWLLLDEPSEGLDAATEARLIAKLDDWLRQTGAGLILVTHRPAMLALVTQRFDLDGQISFAKLAADPRN